MSRSTARRTRAAVAVLAAVLLAGCTSSDPAPSGPAPPAGPGLPAESEFLAGTCAATAGDVLAIGAAVPDLGDGGEVPQPVKDSLRQAQDRLVAIAEGAEPAYKPALDDLVLQVGIVRIRADGNTYEPSQGDDLQASFEQVVSVCTGAAPSRSAD